MNKSDKKVTIKDVAQLAGVSKGTVDRVIHNRGEVSQESFERVMEVIRRIDYKPNVYASVLASRHHYRIVCLVPQFTQGEFWELADQGIKRAFEECHSFNVWLEVIHYDQFRVESFEQVCTDTLNDLPDAVLIVPMFRDQAASFVMELSQKKVPFVFIESKLPDTPYLAYYGMPAFESGRLGASLLLEHEPMTEMACFRFHRSGDAASNTASVRQEGFLDYVLRKKPDCRLRIDYLYPVVCSENDAILDRFFELNPGIRHIVIFNSRAFIVAEYLESHGMADRILLGFDPLERNVKCMKSGFLKYIIAQKGETQAYRGVKALCNHFIFKTDPRNRDNYMSMEILTTENVDFYVDLQIE